VRDLLQFRLGASYHEQDGFMRNTLTIGDMNPLKQQSVGGTLRFTPADWAVFTVNGNYDQTAGGSTSYIHVAGPTDYRLDGATNVLNRAVIDYYGASVKGEFDAASLKTKITAIGAYNQKNVAGINDGDFGPVDLLRTRGGSTLKTKTAELRFDTQWSDAFSTLIGLYGNRYTQTSDQLTTIDFRALLGPTFPAPASTTPSSTYVRNDTRAIFATAFLKVGTLDLAVGGRYDHQKLVASQVNGVTPYTAPEYKKDQFQPRVTLTQHWTPAVMSYASVAKGIRGGGQNGPGTRPEDATYKGDNVWTYELGTKFDAFDRRLTINADVFYNDYKDFIGQNSLAPNTSGGFVAINLNTGTVESYGAEVEAHLPARPISMPASPTTASISRPPASTYRATGSSSHPITTSTSIRPTPCRSARMRCCSTPGSSGRAAGSAPRSTPMSRRNYRPMRSPTLRSASVSRAA